MNTLFGGLQMLFLVLGLLAGAPFFLAMCVIGYIWKKLDS